MDIRFCLCSHHSERHNPLSLACFDCDCPRWVPRHVRAIFLGSNGDATKRLYAELERRGELGSLAVNLFRAQKTSSRAKVYRNARGRQGRGKFTRAAYDTKSWAMSNLCMLAGRSANWLTHEPNAGEMMIGLNWGWKPDPAIPFGERPSHVLYIDLPTGQVSFHSPTRLAGPDYDGEWDGQRDVAADRIIKFCELVLEVTPGINCLALSRHHKSTNAA